MDMYSAKPAEGNVKERRTELPSAGSSTGLTFFISKKRLNSSLRYQPQLASYELDDTFKTFIKSVQSKMLISLYYIFMLLLLYMLLFPA